MQAATTSNLSKAHETPDSLRSSCSQVDQVYFQTCRHNSILKCATKLKIAKNTETSYFGSSMSFEVIDVDTIKKLVTSACYGKQYVCVFSTVFTLSEPIEVK